MTLRLRSLQLQVQTQRTDFRPENLPLHCFMNFRLVDEYGRQIDLDRNLGKLRSEFAQSAREVFQEVAASAVGRLTPPTSNNKLSDTSLQTQLNFRPLNYTCVIDIFDLYMNHNQF